MGATIKVHSRKVEGLPNTPANLRSQPRNYCLFVLGENTDFRLCEQKALVR